MDDLRMRWLKKIIASLKPAVGRFPATFFLSMVTAFLLSALVHIGFLDSDEQLERLSKILRTLSLSTIWCMVFSCAAQLAMEQLARILFLSRKKQGRMLIITRLASIALVVPLYFLWGIEGERIYLAYGMTLFALVALCPYLLHFTQKDNEIVLNISFSALISSIISCCVGTGLSIIWLAFTLLVHKFKESEQVYMWIWIFAFFAAWIGSFISYCSKPHEDIIIPKSCKVIFLYVLFPLYLLLLAVLYIYLGKCLVTLSLPMRDINLFASFATALYLLFYLTLSYYRARAVRLFLRFGSFVLLPLVAVQCYISIDRILAHGISMARYASVLYITFSIVVIFLSFMQKGKYMLFCCFVLAGLALFSSLTPWNLIDVPFRSQTGIIIRTLEKYGLFADGRVIAEKTEATLSDEDKNTIIRAYNKLDGIERKPDWYADDFKATFGFAYRKYGGEDDTRQDWKCVLELPSDSAIPISPYTELYVLDFDNANDRQLVKYAGKAFDLKEKFDGLWKQAADGGGTKRLDAPLLFTDGEGYTVCLTYLNLCIYNEDEEEFLNRVRSGNYWAEVRGYAFR